jgi:6-phosphofructokinase 1
VDTCIKGTRRVDVAAFYDADAYRPRMAEFAGKPMFLY